MKILGHSDLNDSSIVELTNPELQAIINFASALKKQASSLPLNEDAYRESFGLIQELANKMELIEGPTRTRFTITVTRDIVVNA